MSHTVLRVWKTASTFTVESGFWGRGWGGVWRTFVFPQCHHFSTHDFLYWSNCYLLYVSYRRLFLASRTLAPSSWAKAEARAGIRTKQKKIKLATSPLIRDTISHQYGSHVKILSRNEVDEDQWRHFEVKKILMQHHVLYCILSLRLS
jgi:hypothetical protein